MCSQPNTVFLGYSQDAVRRLPAVLSAVLSQRGYDVYRDKNHFRRFDAPSPSILAEIEQRSHYVLLLTPASVRYGFNLDERRLMVEIKHAIRTKRHIVVVWAYSDTPLHMSWWTQSFFPDHFEHVQMDNVDVDQLVASLDSLLSGRASGRRQYPLTDAAGLEVEMRVDRGLTEIYEAQFYNRRSDAITYFNEALNLDSSYARAYAERGDHDYWCLFSIEEKANAYQLLADYDTAIQFEPDEARYYGGRARLYSQLRDRQTAIEDYTSAIQYASEEATYYSFRAQAYKDVGDLQNALADCSMAIQIKPQEACYYFSRSGIYFEVKDFQSALKDMSSAIELDPTPRYFIIRGFLHFDLGDSAKAETDWKVSVEASTNPIYAHSIRAQMHFRRGEMQQALEVVQHILLIEPNRTSALQLRNRILNNNSGPLADDTVSD